ncbi:MAG: tellurite resistance TerB family protein [Gammaproteobacteria bacterium]|nr:tellurite resistance TerB family protein [Gammaproteobacteria bacterium]
MIDPNRLLDQLMRSGIGGGLAGGLLSGALAGSLAGRKNKGFGSSALKAGGLAAVAGLAYKAWQQYQAGQGGGAAPQAGGLGSIPGFGADPVPSLAATGGMAVLRAMIAAAKADGQVDAAEHQKIFGELGRLDLSADEKAFVLEEFGRPLDVDTVVASATSDELARQVYAASRLIVAEASPAEAAYLQLLAARLGLAPALVAEIDRAALQPPAA